MAVNYISQKCPFCGSTSFEYVKEEKIWECIYCGARIERKEQADNLFTIKNVVRQVLLDVAYKRFNDAKANLVECEKIDSRYVGTIIAKICYFINAASFSADITQQEKQNMIAQAKKYYTLLVKDGSDVGDEEVSLYEFLDSAEAYGVLILIFDTLNLDKKAEFVYQFFNPDEIYSMDLNSNLLRFMLKKEKYEIADKIVSNYDNLEKRSAIQLLLSSYPDGEKKIENCSLLISQNVFNSEDARIIEKYLKETSDSIKTKSEIAYQALMTNAKPSIECIMQNVILSVKSEDDVKHIVDALMSRKLADNEIYTIVDYALGKCNQAVILYIFESFIQSNQFVVLNYQHFITLLNNKEISTDYRKSIIDLAIDFNVNDKKKEQFISYYLLNIKDSPQEREEMVHYLLSLIPSLSSVSIENYIVSCTIDGDKKPSVVKELLNENVNRAFLRETFDKYIQYGKDSSEVYDKIVNILAENGLGLSEGALLSLLFSNRDAESKLMILKKILNTGVRYLTILDKYLANVPIQMYSSSILQELINCSDSISGDAFVRYLLTISEQGKPANVQKLLQKCNIPIAQKGCFVNHLGKKIECSVIQAYVLISPDPVQTSCAVLDALGARQIKINSDIYIDGSHKKFKKYLSSVKTSLSGITLEMCKYLGLM